MDISEKIIAELILEGGKKFKEQLLDAKDSADAVKESIKETGEGGKKSLAGLNEALGGNTTSLKLMSFAQKVLTASFAESTLAVKLFKVALASTGIGLIVIALASLYVNLDKVKEIIYNTFPALKNLGDTFDRVKANIIGFLDGVFEALKVVVKTLLAIAVPLPQNLQSASDAWSQAGGKIAKAYKDGYEEEMRKAKLEDFIKMLGDQLVNYDYRSGFFGAIGEKIRGARENVKKELTAFNLAIANAQKEIKDFNVQAIRDNPAGWLGTAILGKDDKQKELLQEVGNTYVAFLKANKGLADAQQAQRKKDEADAEKARKEAEKQAEEARKAKFEKAKQELQDKIAVAQLALTNEQTTGKKRLALAQDLEQALVNLKKFGSNTDAKSIEEKAQLQADADEKIFNLELQYNRARLQASKDIISQQLQLVEAGTRDELALKLKALAIASAMERQDITNGDSTPEEKAKRLATQEELNAKKRSQLLLRYNADQRASVLKAEAEELKIKQIGAEKNSREAFDIARSLAYNKASIAKLGADTEIQNEEAKAREIRRINEQLTKDLSDINAQQAKQAQAEKLAKIQHYADVASVAIGYAQILADFTNNVTGLVVQAGRQNADEEIRTLDEKKKKGIISEKQYQKELNKIKNEQAQKEYKARIAEMAMQIPVAVLSAFIAGLPYGGLIGAGIFAGVALAFATAQLGLAIKNKPPKFAKGGFVGGRSHADGGTFVEAEKGEFIHNTKAVKHYGVKFMEDVNNLKFNPILTARALLKNKDIASTKDYKTQQHLATIATYLKRGQQIEKEGNDILEDISEKINNNRGIYV